MAGRLPPRAPAVAGRFYPATAEALRRQVARFMPEDPDAVRVRAIVGPHAGYVYSGAILGETYARVEVPGSVVILCPNHTGLGARRSIRSSGDWEIPGARVRVDTGLAERIRELASLEVDELAHAREHAIEVHLPFLHARNPDVAIVPICLAGLSVAACREIGEAIAIAIAESGADTLIAVSTDMSHFLTAEEARSRDDLAIARVLELDPDGLYETVRTHDISMCGFIPATVALHAVRAQARACELVRYGNSGDTTGDYDRVVGYAGFVIA